MKNYPKIYNLFLFLTLMTISILNTQPAQTAENLPPPPAISASLIASRTSCVAPCSVFFDASGTTATTVNSSFRDLNYNLNYGDENGAVHRLFRKSKNKDPRPLGSHLYKQPGTYTATLTVSDHLGNQDTKETTIVVTDPNIVYTNICVSSSNNFLGCPAGASHISTNNLNNLNLGTNKRILLRKGDSFTANYPLNLNFPGPFEINTFPLTGNGYANVNASAGLAGFPWNNIVAQDHRIIGLNITGNGTSQAISGAGPNLLLMNNIISNYNDGFMVSDSAQQNNVAVLANTFSAIREYSIYFASMGQQITISDNAVTPYATGAQHPLRIHTPGKILVEYNAFIPGDQKVTAGGKIGGRDANNPARHVIIADNSVKRATAEWMAFEVSPNDAGIRPVQEAIIENNLIDGRDFPGKSSFMARSVDGLTIRNNVFLSNSNILLLGQSFPESIWKNLDIYNNSIYNSTGGFIALQSQASPTQAFQNIKLNNNIFSAPTPDSAKVIDLSQTPVSAVSAQNNIYNFSTSSNYPLFRLGGGSYSLSQWQDMGQDLATLTINPNFINSNNGNLHLQSTSNARDLGINGPGIPENDKDGVTREGHGPAIDLGAYEYWSN